MQNIGKTLAGIVITIAATPLVAIATANADTPDAVYFSYGTEVNCAITDDGIVGCDVTPARMLTVPGGSSVIPIPIPVRQVVIDQDWLPAHPGSASGAFTLRGGNPSISDVATGDGYASVRVEHAGALCQATGGHYSGPGLYCESKGHAFEMYAEGGVIVLPR